MRDLTQSRVASGLTILLGGWLALSPIWISVSGWALASVLAVGGFMVLMGLVQLFIEDNLPSWLAGIAAVWLFASAYIFDVSDSVVWNQVLSSVAAVILAFWDGIEITHAHDRHQHRLV
ncbi:MAG TPA: hypothetical protein VG964_02715 [Candidatus Saccharimonadales bacterium]|nr:hypothetical protein [Candidatus Saccharimonadales bacterium]